MGSLVLFGAATSMAFLGLEAPSRAAPMVKPWDKFDSLGDTEVSDASGAAEDVRTVLHGEPT